jgi:hypothetical protein
MRKWNPIIDARLKTEMCPGGRGHNPGPRFKSQCTFCRTTAHLAPPPEAEPIPVPEPVITVPTPEKKGFVPVSKTKKKKLV